MLAGRYSNTKFEENLSRYSIGLDDVDTLKNGMVTDGAGKVGRKGESDRRLIMAALRSRCGHYIFAL